MASTKTTKKKKKERNDAPYKKLQEDLKAGTAGGVYLFHGEEAYLRQHSLDSLRRLLIPRGCEEFNYHPLEGKGLLVQQLEEIAEAMPMLAEHTFITVTDWDLFKLPEDQRNRLTAFLTDVPPHCCLVFNYATIPYEPNGNMRRLTAALKDHVQVVEFNPSEPGPLIKWVRKHFAALDKRIGDQEAGYLIFTCGNLMAGLAPEIQKIAAYARGEDITQADIDAVAVPILSAEAFRMADAVVQGKSDQAAVILGNLLALKTRPEAILWALGRQLRQLWTARVALERGKSSDWLAKLWKIHPYPARLMMDAARRTSPDWCREAAMLCQALDLRLKSQRGVDGGGELMLLLVRLEARR